MDQRLVTLPAERPLQPAGGESSPALPAQDADVVQDRLFGRIPGWARSRPVALVMGLAYAAMAFGLVRLFLSFVLGVPLPDWLVMAAMGGVMLGSLLGAIFFTVLMIWQSQDGIRRQRASRQPDSNESFP